jgi:WD40-like Beta Propeller Repeat
MLRWAMAMFAVVAGAAAGAATTVWAPKAISSDRFESHPAFDPLTGDLYFVRSAPDFSGWRIYVSHCEKSGWTTPVDAPFAGDGVEADPWFTSDGHTLYFISTRTTDGVTGRNLDLWRVTRDAALKWQTPTRLPEPLSAPSREWFPRIGRDGWLYFGSDRAGGAGKTDIWRAREEQGKWSVENLGPNINTAANEFEAEMSPDGNTLIVMAEDGLYESSRSGDRWGARRKLPAEINVNATEVGALFSPSGQSMLFARDTGKPLSGEFILWKRGTPEDWPKPCGE